MNGHTENKKNTYAHLDRLSTEALEELLCADIKSLDDDDDEVVAYSGGDRATGESHSHWSSLRCGQGVGGISDILQYP